MKNKEDGQLENRKRGTQQRHRTKESHPKNRTKEGQMKVEMEMKMDCPESVSIRPVPHRSRD